MKKLGYLVLVLSMILGCSSLGTIQHSESIDTDSQGAVGQYRDVRSGNFHDVFVGFGASGWGGAGAGGLGGLVVGIQAPPTQGNSMDFARSVAMINYSKKLKSVRYDEGGDIIEYDFDGKPAAPGAYRPTEVKPLPKAFGRQSLK